MRTSVLIHKHSKGVRLAQLAKDYNIDEGKLEGGLKYTILWVLNALSQICDSRKCYKLNFLKLQILELIEDISLGATLGKLLAIEGIGKITLMKLADKGIPDLEHLSELSVDDIIKIGIHKTRAIKLKSFVSRRNR